MTSSNKGQINNSTHDYDKEGTQNSQLNFTHWMKFTTATVTVFKVTRSAFVYS